MKLTNITTQEVLMEFNQHDQPIFHDTSLGRELFDFGISIPPEARTNGFLSKTVVFPAQNESDVTALKLFKKAFVEIYYSPNLMKRCNLEWRS